MKLTKTIVLGVIAMTANVLFAAESGPKEKLADAFKQLNAKSNYSWTSSSQEADGSPGRLGLIEGKTEKKLVYLSFSPGGIPVEVYMKGDKGAAKALEGWQTFDEISQTSGTAAAIVRFLKTSKAPVAECTSLAGHVKEFKTEDGVVSGELKEEAVKEMLSFGARRREGQDAPQISDAKGTTKFWVKDGALTKYETNVQGKVKAGDREAEINRTTTVEIKDAGSTKIDMPAEAKEKMM